HRVHGWLRTTVYLSRDDADRIARLLVLRARRNISVAHPIAEGSLTPEGYRAHVALHVVTRRGSTFTIRKYAEEPFTLPRLVALHSIDPRIAGYLWLSVDHIVSMLIGGPMGSGKTTLLNTIAMLLRPEYKIVTLEDTPEIFLPHENWVPLITRPSFEAGVEDIGLYDLLRSSLRQRPEYLIIGEIRGEEAYTFFQAIAVGHGGLATIHGESIAHIVNRLRSPPMNVPLELLPLVKVYILNLNYPSESGLRRRVADVKEAEHVDPETGRLTLNTLATYDPSSDTWEISPRSKVIEFISERTGISVLELREEWERRSTIMKYLGVSGKYDMRTVLEYIKRYAVEPDSVYGEAEARAGRVTLS
ncbi:MAG: type II/IV secretion system ATPase subunit, partial [Desulfurococcales archaeon]|nr:type II/IV secretion system ATPase subunit [Desulfurococcales archaeon]